MGQTNEPEGRPYAADLSADGGTVRIALEVSKMYRRGEVTLPLPATPAANPSGTFVVVGLKATDRVFFAVLTPGGVVGTPYSDPSSDYDLATGTVTVHYQTDAGVPSSDIGLSWWLTEVPVV